MTTTAYLQQELELIDLRLSTLTLDKAICKTDRHLLLTRMALITQTLLASDPSHERFPEAHLAHKHGGLIEGVAEYLLPNPEPGRLLGTPKPNPPTTAKSIFTNLAQPRATSEPETQT